MFGRLGVWEILLIVLLVVVLFGHNKIPGMMKNIANGLNVFKKELKTEEQTEAKPVTAKKPAATKVTAKKKPVAKKSSVKKPVKR